MQTEYDYSVVRPTVDKNKLRELASMISGRPAPIIHKPTLYLRKFNSKSNNIQRNVYGNNIAAWKTQGASSFQRPSRGETAAKRRIENERKASLRELGRMVRGY
jgi:hypothetical protein